MLRMGHRKGEAGGGWQVQGEEEEAMMDVHLYLLGYAWLLALRMMI